MENLFFALVTKLWTEMGIDFDYYAKRHLFSSDRGNCTWVFMMNEKWRKVRFAVLLNEAVPPEKTAEILTEINNFNLWWAGQGYCLLNECPDGENRVEYYTDYYFMDEGELSEARLRMMTEQAKNMDMFGNVTEWKSYL